MRFLAINMMLPTILRHLLLSCAYLYNSILGWTIDNPDEFIRQHTITDSMIIQILDETFYRDKVPEVALRLAGCTFLSEDGKIIAQHPKIPNFLIKCINQHHDTFASKIIRFFHGNRNIQRILVNETIKKKINTARFKHIVAPQKYLYHIPGRPLSLSDENYIVLSEKLDILCKKCNRHQFAHHLSLEQEQEVMGIIETIGYGDAHLDNICFLRNGKIAFIDTEPHGTVDFLTVIPGFERATHALSVKVGQDLFRRECHARSLETETREPETLCSIECYPECTWCNCCQIQDTSSLLCE